MVQRSLDAFVRRDAELARGVIEADIYIVRGEDVRERGDKEVRQGLRPPPASPPR